MAAWHDDTWVLVPLLLCGSAWLCGTLLPDDDGDSTASLSLESGAPSSQARWRVTRWRVAVESPFRHDAVHRVGLALHAPVDPAATARVGWLRVAHASSGVVTQPRQFDATSTAAAGVTVTAVATAPCRDAAGGGSACKTGRCGVANTSGMPLNVSRVAGVLLEWTAPQDFGSQLLDTWHVYCDGTWAASCPGRDRSVFLPAVQLSDRRVVTVTVVASVTSAAARGCIATTTVSLP
jgi:hypothetical protein